MQPMKPNIGPFNQGAQCSEWFRSIHMFYGSQKFATGLRLQVARPVLVLAGLCHVTIICCVSDVKVLPNTSQNSFIS